MIANPFNRLQRYSPRIAALSVVLALTLLPGATTALAKGNGSHLPFKGTLQSVEIGVFDPGPPVTLSVTANGSGNGTHLGRFAYSYTVVIFLNPDNSGTGTLYYDFVAANGDHL